MSIPGDVHMPRAPAMPVCLAPRRCPHASRPGDARMPRAPAMPACLAPRRCPHASRPSDARMPRAPAMTDVLLIPAMTDDTSPRLAEEKKRVKYRENKNRAKSTLPSQAQPLDQPHKLDLISLITFVERPLNDRQSLLECKNRDFYSVLVSATKREEDRQRMESQQRKEGLVAKSRLMAADDRGLGFSPSSLNLILSLSLCIRSFLQR
ncbi:hypothetical protein VNO80_05132 [Phaseolus coccineus]|uniref:Uncharacterized protein n=1 Tax=Phaseolus coccineus TaxID=3886 RepID=A0AAN9NJ87_PHACN